MTSLSINEANEANEMRTAQNEKQCLPKMQSFPQNKTAFLRASLFIFGRFYFIRALEPLLHIGYSGWMAYFEIS